MDDVSKPSRRFKKMNMQELEGNGRPTTNIGKTTRSKEEGYDIDKEVLYFDSERESEEGADLTGSKVKLD